MNNRHCISTVLLSLVLASTVFASSTNTIRNDERIRKTGASIENRSPNTAVVLGKSPGMGNTAVFAQASKVTLPSNQKLKGSPTLRLHFALYEVSVNDMAKLRSLLPPPSQPTNKVIADDTMKRAVQFMRNRHASLTVSALCRSGDQGQESKPLGRRRSQIAFLACLDASERCDLTVTIGIWDAKGNLEAGVAPAVLLTVGDTVLSPLDARGLKTGTQNYCLAIRYDGIKQ